MYHYQGIQPNLNPNDQRNKKKPQDQMNHLASWLV